MRELYSILFVDDEEDVISVIMKKLDWEAMGYRILGYAKNGMEALELAEEMMPDVVMTDIKMPYMDGLTLSKRLKELYHDVKIVIFSGFDEFDYAKEAIKLEAEEYILKPIRSTELQEVFERVKKGLDKERDEKRNIEKLQNYYQESLPLLQKNFLVALVEGRVPESEIEEYKEHYRLNLEGPCYLVIQLHIGKADSDQGVSRVLLSASVEKLVKEEIKDSRKINEFSYMGDIFLLVQLEEKENINILIDKADAFCRLAKKICKANVTAGIGYIVDSLRDLPLSYEGAMNAVSYRVLYGSQKAIAIEEIDPCENAQDAWEEQAIYRIFKRIKLGTGKEIEEAIDDCIKKVENMRSIPQSYQFFIMEFITYVFRFVNNNSIAREEIFTEGSDVYKTVLEFGTVSQLKGWMTETAYKLQAKVKEQREGNTKSFVKSAKQYVSDHYAKADLGLDTICKTLGVSSAYFSTVFKKETGKTFINYLTEVRMEKAARLLLENEDKTYIIAEKTGYQDPNYFSYAFKKYFGQSPSKYRQGKREK